MTHRISHQFHPAVVVKVRHHDSHRIHICRCAVRLRSRKPTLHQCLLRLPDARHPVKTEKVQCLVCHIVGMIGRTVVFILDASQQFHTTVIVIIQAPPERPMPFVTVLVDFKTSVPFVFREDKEREAKLFIVIKREQNVHVTVLVEVVAMNVRHVQILHQGLFLETVTAQVGTGVHPLAFRIIIDVVGNAIAVQVLHGQLARLPGGHEAVVAHVIENRARPHQIHIAVAVHVDCLREFVAFIHLRTSPHEHAVTQRRQATGVELPVSLFRLTGYQRIGLHTRKGIDARGGKRPVGILVENVPVRSVEREQVRKPVVVHVQRIGRISLIHQTVGAIPLAQSYFQRSEIREVSVREIRHAVIVQVHQEPTFILVTPRQIKRVLPHVTPGGTPNITIVFVSPLALTYCIIFLHPVAIGIIKERKVGNVQGFKRDGTIRQ